MRYWLMITGLWLARLGGWSTDLLREQLRDRDRTIATLGGLVAELKTTLAAREQEIWRLQREIERWDIPTEILTRATELSRETDTMYMGGEAKRHLVYAKLIKEFPNTPKRDLALAIELALPPKEG